jgi:aryl-alcohol dehydrogenase-like predicted oxidoreductase
MNYIEKICLGTAQFGSSYGLTNKNKELSIKQIGDILSFAKKSGICFLDTAPTYGNAEHKLGNLELRNWNIITKVGASKALPVNHSFSESIKNSFSSLKIDRLYGILLHDPMWLYDPQINNLLCHLSELKSKGLIQKIGVSVYDSEEVDFILANFDVDLIQIPYSIIDGRMVVNGTLDKLKKRNIEVHARSIYLQGLLLMDIKDQIQQFGKWESIWKAFKLFCLDNKISPLEACLRHVLQNRQIDRVILGIDNYSQLEETIVAANGGFVNFSKDIISLDENLLNPTNW